MRSLPRPVTRLFPHRFPRAIAAALLALSIGGAHAVETAAFARAQTQFLAARDGDNAAIDNAAERFDALLAAEPAHPLLLAYAGSTTALRARAALWPWKKMSHAEDGLARIDKALALLQPAHDLTLVRGVPVSLETRLVAANTFLALPAMFNRGARGQRLLAEIAASPLLARTPQGFQDAVLAGSAQAAKAAP